MSNFENIKRIKEKLKKYIDGSLNSDDSKSENSVEEFNDFTKFEKEKLSGTFDDCFNKKIENSPYFNKISEVIEKKQLQVNTSQFLTVTGK